MVEDWTLNRKAEKLMNGTLTFNTCTTDKQTRHIIYSSVVFINMYVLCIVEVVVISKIRSG